MPDLGVLTEAWHQCSVLLRVCQQAPIHVILQLRHQGGIKRQPSVCDSPRQSRKRKKSAALSASDWKKNPNGRVGVEEPRPEGQESRNPQGKAQEARNAQTRTPSGPGCESVESPTRGRVRGLRLGNRSAQRVSRFSGRFLVTHSKRRVEAGSRPRPQRWSSTSSTKIIRDAFHLIHSHDCCFFEPSPWLTRR